LLLSAPSGVVAQPRSGGCATCQIELSVHHRVVRCQECHGGEDLYELPEELWRRFEQLSTTRAVAASQPAGAPADRFDHGSSFRGKATRAQIPDRCGTCHSDVERMNPYGLRTDQLASYWVSGHGKHLKREGDDRVAVCTDCHGTHDVLRSSNPQSRTHFRNIPQTCAHCHADRALMQKYNIPADIPAQYSRSVHGRNLLERGDSGSPHCATCHGNHAAAPPGYLEVGHVCGQCHKQIEEYFLASVHGKIPVMARCVGCHAKDGQRWNHEIEEATPPVERILEAYKRIYARIGDDPQALRKGFEERVDDLSGSLRLGTVCLNCHAAGRRDPHGRFFVGSDERARETGRAVAEALRDAQFEYCRAAERVERLARGVLLVRDEAVRAEDAKTELMSLYAYVHTLNRPEIQSRVQNTKQICQEVHASLDRKEQGLMWRRASLLPAWLFVLLFAAFMYPKYAALKRAYVSVSGHVSSRSAALAEWGRRRFLNGVLAVMGGVSLLAILWPAVAYVLPARKRGGGGERVSAGRQEGWAAWEARKVSVRGKPVAVLRTDTGFRAFSAVCTHLGCIVHWNKDGRKFECPCHAAAFDAAGKVLAGPPPKALPEYAVSVVQDEVIVKDA